MNDVREGILAVLRESDGFVSGQRLCENLKMSRAAISKHVQALRKLGYKIESIPRRGHRLITTVDTPLDVEVARHLKSKLIGRHYTFEPEIASTNAYLSNLPLSECTDGMVMAADQQTSGRGRMQRTWFSPAGCNLYFSVLLQPRKNIADIPQLALIAALSVIDALKTTAPSVDAGVKWPNDVLVNGRKLAGILCEMQAEADIATKVILGIGINVNVASEQFPADLRERSTSLLAETGKHVDRPQLMAALLNSLDKYYRQWLTLGLAPFLPVLKERLLLVGKKIRVQSLDTSIAGIVKGLSPEGGLVLYDGKKTYTVFSGEVHIGDSGYNNE